MQFQTVMVSLFINFFFLFFTGTKSESGQKDMELRKTSIYNTIDMAPQLDYYANTLPHQEIKIRPSLDVLRKTFEVRFPPVEKRSHRCVFLTLQLV